MRERCVPGKKQLEFLSWEFGVFFHFGIRTFYGGHRDWDLKEMPAEGFCPSDFSAEDWCGAASAAGAKYAVMTAKHHDGFANWPSAYTEYSVKNTPWKGGRGDAVREFTDACRKFGLKVGLYYSPAQFGSVKMNAEEYNRYFINQIGELLTGYGKIDYLWFDGCGSENHRYDEKRIIKAIREYQPEILVFNMWDPDTCWCGNEDGYSRYPNIYEKNVSAVSCGSREGDTADGRRFLPDECDCRIRDMWFYGEEDAEKLKSVDVLMGMYEMSVGRGSNLLLNIGPDRRGRLAEADRERLLEFGSEIRKRYSDTVPGRASAGENCLEVVFGEERDFNCVILEEELSGGQSVMRFDIDVGGNGFSGDYTPYTVFYGSTVGNRMICRFPTVRRGGFRVNIRCCDGEWKLKKAVACLVGQN